MRINEDYLDNIELDDENPADEIEMDVIPKIDAEPLTNKEIIAEMTKICGEMTVQHFKDYADNKKSRFIGRQSHYYKAMFTNTDGDWRQTSFIAFEPQKFEVKFLDGSIKKVRLIAKICGQLRYMTEYTYRYAITGNETDLGDWRKFSPDQWIGNQNHEDLVRLYDEMYRYYIYRATLTTESLNEDWLDRVKSDDIDNDADEVTVEDNSINPERYHCCIAF